MFVLTNDTHAVMAHNTAVQLFCTCVHIVQVQLTSSGGGVDAVPVIRAEALTVCSLNGVVGLLCEACRHTCTHVCTQQSQRRGDMNRGIHITCTCMYQQIMCVCGKYARTSTSRKRNDKRSTNNVHANVHSLPPLPLLLPSPCSHYIKVYSYSIYTCTCVCASGSCMYTYNAD